ncbi:MAG: hypothetical protein JWM57_2455 [Phycisphaerales bacterium]|nr:hypothetical protein [Phycisphaerales bacterium]
MAVDHRARLPVRVSLATLVGMGLLGGCQKANPAVQRSQQAADVLTGARQSLGVSEQAVVQSQAALRTLGQSKGDLQPPFAAFVLQLEAVRKEAARQQDQGEAVLGQATWYVGARQKDISTINNDELRHTAEQRTAKMQAQTQTIKDLYGRMNNAFGVYIRNLSDLQTYLANDLNYGALNSGQRWVTEAATSGEKLRGTIRDLAVQIDLMSNTLSPVPIPTSPWPTTLRTTEPAASQP